MKRVLLLTIFLSSIHYLNGYPNPSEDIDYTGFHAKIDDVEEAYNTARKEESEMLGSSLPTIDFPDQSSWDKMSPSEKGLWLINEERVARGLMPFEAVDKKVTSITTSYASYLTSNNKSGHKADGLGTLKRFKKDKSMKSCLQTVKENIGYRASSNGYPSYALERTIFSNIYSDSRASWLNRQTLLMEGLVDDSGSSGKEGIVSVAVDRAGNYDGGGKFPKKYKYAVIVVIDIIDPCEDWKF